MKKLKFEKGITKIHIPIYPLFGGELEKKLEKFMNDKRLPKFQKITLQRSVSFRKGLEYDSTEIIIEK